jgi:hypothetical protein
MSNKVSKSLSSFVRFILAFASRKGKKTLHLDAVSSKLGKLKTQVLLAAYAIWSMRGIARVHGFTVRVGATVASAISKGVALLVEIIVLTLAAYFTAFLVPGALTAIATTALTSVSGAVQTLFQTVLSMTIVATIIMLFIGIIVETFRGL